ncbi:FecR family protein [Sphingomonas sp.]|uniref:FecR family protein n=1 Tax=Sphingomonas sp. TaxID=28214 RepID=UPI003D6D86B4
MTGNDDAFDPVIVDAADWLVRLTSGEATDADAQALADWRAQSPDHDAAFRQVAGLRTMARALGDAPAAGVSRRGIVLGGSMAAVFAAIGLAKPPLALWPSLSELMADHRTGPGERYAFAPIAGVRVEMNSRTSLSLAGGNRGIGLIDGETFISVATDAVFRVAAGDVQVEAMRALFNVSAIDGIVHTACLHGAIACRLNGRRINLTAGDQLSVDAQGVVARTRVNPAIATAWRRGLLIFEETPLAEVVAQINRYRPGRIVLTSSGLGQRQVSGVFHIKQIENAVAQIQQLLGLHLRHLPAGVILMG